MFVKPAEGRAVRWPGTKRLLAAEGAEVPADSFWLLCRRNGDVVNATPPAAEPASEPEAAHDVPEPVSSPAPDQAPAHEGAAA